MKSLNLKKTLSLVLGLGLLTGSANAAKLSDPVTTVIEGSSMRFSGNVPLDQVREAAQVAPVEGWRVRALDALKQSDSPERGGRDFALLTEGVNAKPAGRDLAQEFIAELPDARLAAAFRAGLDDRSSTIVAARARLALSEAVLSRSALSADHPGADYERGCMLLVVGATREDVLAAFERTASRSAANAEAASRGRAAVAALRDPQTPADYATAVELLDLSTQYWSRKPGTWVATRTLRQLKEQGSRHFDPARFSGDSAPIRAAARVAFELDQPELLTELLEIAERSTISPADLVEVRYWTAMCSYANRDYQPAIGLFEKNMFSGVQSKYVAESGFEAGQSAILSYDFAMAGVYLFDVMETYKQFPEPVAKAQRAFDFLLESGKLDDASFQTALAKYRQSQQLAMVPSNTAKN